jgi:hypothetical protein
MLDVAIQRLPHGADIALSGRARGWRRAMA